jgi:hypothetical protein
MWRSGWIDPHQSFDDDAALRLEPPNNGRLAVPGPNHSAKVTCITLRQNRLQAPPFVQRLLPTDQLDDADLREAERNLTTQDMDAAGLFGWLL